MSATLGSERRADLLTVGAGPQVLRALADLESALAASDGGVAGGGQGARVRVVAVDPFDAGSGAVWRVDQPAYLTMNVSASVVDLRCPSVPWDLRQWHERERGSACPTYPARAVVGAYLQWAWRTLTTSPWLDPTHVRGRVVDVERRHEEWACRLESGVTMVADRVLLGTGHREPAPFAYASLERSGGTGGQDATVLVRGAALTAFDAVLCLTAGRGGRWEIDPADALVPRYRPSGREPQRIVLVSRSGRMMLPKPVQVSDTLREAVDGVSTRWTQRAPLGEAWWETLVEAAVRAAAACGVELDAARARNWLDDPPAAGGTARLALRWRADLRRARGEVDDDPAWWLGRAWSAGYQALLASIERTPRQPESWLRFRRRAATLERWAFGPPAELVARLVALIDEGLLTVAAATEAAGAAGPSAADVVGHIAGPGVLAWARPWDEPPNGAEVGAAPTPWAGLLAAGHVVVRAGETGVLTTPAGGCIGADGQETRGLSALGRPTEGPVVDHDSLQRRLHLDAQRWAERMAEAWTDRALVRAGTREESGR